MASASEIQVLISAQTEELQAGMAEAQEAVASGAAGMEAAMAGAAASTESSAATMSAALMGVNEAVETVQTTFKALSEVAIVGVFIEGARGLREMVESTNEQEVALLHLSQRLSESVPELRELQGVMSLADVPTQSFTRAMTMLASKLTQAEAGSKSAVAAFERIHVSIAELQGLSPEQAFLKVADAFANLQDGMEKTGAASALFSARFGGQLLPIFDLGSAKIQQLMADFGALDPVTKQDAETAEQLHASWVALSTTAESLGRSIAHDLRPAIEGVESGFIKAMAATKAWLDVTSAHGFFSLKPFDMAEVNKFFDDYEQTVKKAQDIGAAAAGLSPAGQEGTADVTKQKPEGSAESTYDNSESVLMTHLEARQAAIKAEADAELAIWTEAAKNVEAVDMSKFALEAEQIKSAAAQHVITASQETTQLLALNQQELTSKLTTINNEIAALQQAGAQEKDYYDKIAALQAQAAVLQNQYATKALQIQTSTAVQTQNAWTKSFDAIGSEFNTLVDTILKGGQGVTAASAFGQLGEHLFEGAIGSITKDLSTALAQAIESSAAVGAMKTLFTQAFGSLSGGAAGGAASGALGGATSGVFEKMASSLGSLAVSGAQALEQLFLQVGQAVLQTALLGVLAVESTGKSIPIVGTLFEKGGIVSAAGGAVIGGGGNFGIPIIAHAGEAVLPADITTGMRRAIAGGTFGGGGGGGGDNYSVVVNFNANGVLSSDLRAHADTIGNIVAQKIRDQRFTGQNVNRGAFRR